MQHKCSACEDTGNLSKHLAGNLDCTSCSAATDRAELEKWLYKNTAIGDQDSAWLIHQRALAMAPKQEAPEPAMQDCGACHGSGWVSRDPDIGTEQECFACDGSGKSEDASPAAANGVPDDQPLIGKLMDKLCFLPVLWGLNEPGALLRHGDVFRMLVDANREQVAVIATASPDAAPKDLELAAEQLAEYCENMGYFNSYVDDVRAALSGAKGN